MLEVQYNLNYSNYSMQEPKVWGLDKKNCSDKGKHTTNIMRIVLNGTLTRIIFRVYIHYELVYSIVFTVLLLTSEHYTHFIASGVVNFSSISVILVKIHEKIGQNNVLCSMKCYKVS